MSNIKKDYRDSLVFWNESLSNFQPSKINETWIEDKKVLNIINKHINTESNILDFACGSGWFLFEARLRKNFNNGIGIDSSSNVIEINNETVKMSNFNNIQFVKGNESILDDFVDYFDFVSSINFFDVVPDFVIHSSLEKIFLSMKTNAYIFIGLNPDFSVGELVNMLKMTQEGNYFYKNNILRSNKKSVQEWTDIFTKKFKLIDCFKFSLTEQEKKYPRIGFLLQK